MRFAELIEISKNIFDQLPWLIEVLIIFFHRQPATFELFMQLALIITKFDRQPATNRKTFFFTVVKK